MRSTKIVLAAGALSLAAMPAALAETTFFGRTGDVIAVDLQLAFGGSSFSNLQFNTTPTGNVRTSDYFGAPVFGDTGRFYFVPDVGSAQANSQSNRQTKGFQGTLGGTALVDGRVQSFSIFVAPGFSGAGVRATTSSTDAVSQARQQQRLNYLGFPAEGGTALAVDGNVGPQSTSAIKLFQGSVFNTNPDSQPGNFGPQTTAWTNARNAPRWLERVESQPRTERWATSWTIDTIAGARAVDPSIFITALSTRDGYGSDAVHSTHQAGMDIDVRVPDAAENFGNGVLDSIELKVVQTMLAFYNSTPDDAVVDRIIFSNLDVRDEFNRQIGRNIAIGDSSGVHLNHLHIDIEQVRRDDALAAALGDLQHDGYLDVFDVQPFVDAYLADNTVEFLSVVPDGNYCLGDFTADALVGFDDILPFIDTMLANGVTQQQLAPVYALIPEPTALAGLVSCVTLIRRRRTLR